MDSSTELKKIFNRLRRITSRPDLNFSYYQSPNFPILRIDKNVFISVFHCLLHNVMKYADDSCEVSLQCNFEHASGEAVLKVASVGEIIMPNETEKIFAKFGRGQIVERTGRHHNGVGLGLWVARELMQANGGDLTVKLSPENPRYSKFIVHIREQMPN